MAAGEMSLGTVDETAGAPGWSAWLRQWHEDAMPDEGRFRGDLDDEWITPSVIAGTGVRDLQARFKEIGFLPHAQPHGIFDYRTQSASRLFQEYVRAIEGHAEIGAPDGKVGPLTLRHLERWERDGLRPYWHETTGIAPTAEARYWLEVLRLFKEASGTGPTARSLEIAERFQGNCDTRKIAEWEFSSDEIHLIGIRREEWKRTRERRNDDLFVLLVNGHAFYFYGSTDPSAKMADRPDEPFILRGQHRYRFGWHKQSERKRVYRALRPAGPGVLVCRDFERDDAFTDDDLAGGLEANRTINVHWSGTGTSNWSAGCQVIAGRQYIDGEGRKVDCTSYAARTYTDLLGKTRGAYNVLLDLLTVLAPNPSTRNGSIVHYTLLYEKDLELEIAAGRTLATEALANVAGLAGGAPLGESVSITALAERLVDA